MDEVKIVQINANRWTEYRALKLRALQSDPLAFGSTYEDELLDPNEKWMQMFLSPGKYFIGAELNGKLIGTMSIYRESAIKSKHVGHIYNVFIEERYRGRKLAESMIKQLFKVAKEWNIEKINLSVTNTQIAARRFYEKNGFEIIGTSHKEFKDHENYYDEIFMEKFL